VVLRAAFFLKIILAKFRELAKFIYLFIFLKMAKII
jgi:hypothetical protein